MTSGSKCSGEAKAVAARAINEARVALPKELKDGIGTQFDPFFYSAATGALDLTPGESFGEDRCR